MFLLRKGKNMLDKIYGIDYNRYVCGGIGNKKLALIERETVLFIKESEMLKALAEMKGNYCIGEIEVFESEIDRKEYKITN